MCLLGILMKTPGDGVVDVFGPDLNVPEVAATAASEVGVGVPLERAGDACQRTCVVPVCVGGNGSVWARNRPCEPEAVAGEEGELRGARHAQRAEAGDDVLLPAAGEEHSKIGQENLGEGEAVQSFRTLGPHYGTPSVSDVSSLLRDAGARLLTLMKRRRAWSLNTARALARGLWGCRV